MYKESTDELIAYLDRLSRGPFKGDETPQDPELATLVSNHLKSLRAECTRLEDMVGETGKAFRCSECRRLVWGDSLYRAPLDGGQSPYGSCCMQCSVKVIKGP